MLPMALPITPGQYYAWGAEYGTIPSLEHYATQVVVVALDIRENYEPHVLYIVNGSIPLMAACRLEHFRASCSPYPGQPWAESEQLRSAMDQALRIIQQAVVPGQYLFTL